MSCINNLQWPRSYLPDGQWRLGNSKPVADARCPCRQRGVLRALGDHDPPRPGCSPRNVHHGD